MEDCTLFLSTYDGGADMWEGFFTALCVQWPELKLPVAINTESKNFSWQGLDIQMLHAKNKNMPWGKRLINALKQVDTEYILFFLEDFWLDAPVDNYFFEKCRQWMRDNTDVACLSFQWTRGPNIQDGRFERFERKAPDGDYRINCQAALWRRERLIAFIRPHETPWEFEWWGSIRSKRYPDSIYTQKENSKPVFSYNLSVGGVVHKGRWNRNVVLPLAEKYGLSIDYKRRGFFDEILLEPKRRTILEKVLNRIRIMKSLF